MLTHRLNSRFAMTQTQTNILLTQIRAEKKNGRHRCQPQLTSQIKQPQNQGRKHFKKTLVKPTFLFQQLDNNIQQSREKFSKKMNICLTQDNKQYQPKYGRRHYATNLHQQSKSIDTNQRNKSFGKRRFQTSPVNQRKESPMSPFGRKQ